MDLSAKQRVLKFLKHADSQMKPQVTLFRVGVQKKIITMHVI